MNDRSIPSVLGSPLLIRTQRLPSKGSIPGVTHREDEDQIGGFDVGLAKESVLGLRPSSHALLFRLIFLEAKHVGPDFTM